MNTGTKHKITLKTFQVCEPARAYQELGTAADPDSAALIAHALWKKLLDLDRESIVVFTLNARSQITGYRHWTGSISRSPVYPRDVVETCIRLSAERFILVHNHPSGDLTPSVQDNSMTSRLSEISKLLGLQFVDHLIIDPARPDEPYYSYHRALGALS